MTPAEKVDMVAASALSAKVSWDFADTPAVGLQLPSRLLSIGDDGAGLPEAEEDRGGREKGFGKKGGNASSEEDFGESAGNVLRGGGE